MYSPAYKRYVTILLLVVYVCNLTDRGIFAVLMEPIKQEFALSDTQIGFVLGPALVLLYAVLGIPVARWGDRSNRVSIMTGAIALWSGIVVLTAAVEEFPHLVAARVGVGISEAGFTAIAMSVIAGYHAEAERTRALSNFMLAIPIAVIVSNLLAGWLNEIYGWRTVFVAAGLPGIVLAILVNRTVEEPERAADAIPASQQPALRSVFSTLWTTPQLRQLMIAQGLASGAAASISGWVAAFFIRKHGMSTGELGTWLALIGGAGGAAGIWLSGYLITRLGSRDIRIKMRLMAIASVLVVPIVSMVLWSPSTSWALFALLLAQLPMLFFAAPTAALVQDLSPTNMRATMASVLILIQVIAAGGFGIQLIGALSDLLTPLAQDSGSALRLSMTLTSFLSWWAAAHFWKASRDGMFGFAVRY